MAMLHYCTGSPTCAVLVRGKMKCPQHAVAEEHQRPNFDMRRLYRQVRWRQLRADVLSANPLCVDCLKVGLYRRALDVHHKVKPQNQATFYNIHNLEGLCHAHHSQHTRRGE